uniref:Hypothetical conserved protein n=1 Tax=uncultured Bacteroidota bacterium TaxID=152509 RepID=H5SGK2_9BACT|nr:hypothetical conserved protein [uncultured Bacteroidetes bacterium]
MQKASAFPRLSEWEIDPYHTQIRFRVMHMGLVEVVGRFRQFSARVQGTSPDFSDLRVEVEIATASVETDFPARDAHLRSADFFDAEKYPSITFVSTGIRWRPLKHFILEGDLTMKGITHRIQLEGTLKGLVLKDLTGYPRASFVLRGQIDRRAWGLNWQAEVDNGVAVADNIVTLDIEAEIATPQSLQILRQYLSQMGV